MNSVRSTIFCIIDGMMDPAFDVQDYPNLASMELRQWQQSTPAGRDPESLTCILTLLGIREIPEKLRGYTEALGAGIRVEDTDLILRGSWMSVGSDGRISSPTDAPPQITFPGIKYYPMEEYRSLLVLPGQAASIDQIQTVPPYATAGKPPQAFRPQGHPALELLFEELLTEERCLIPWGESIPSTVPPFAQKAAVVCGADIVRGIARLLQMDIVDVPGATGDTDTDLDAKAEAALSAAKSYPFVLLHINGADEAAHRRDIEEKRAFLKKVDRMVLRTLLASTHELIVTSDHVSDPATGKHEAALQPLFGRKPE